jgi:O-antigen ligase
MMIARWPEGGHATLISMNKTLVIAGGVLVALMPWFGGGRDAVALLITSFALLIAGLLLLRQSGRKTVAGWVLRWAITCWLAWGAFSLVWSVNRFQSELWLLLMALAVTAAIITANLNQEARAKLVVGYTWVAAIFGAVGIFMMMTGSYDRLTSTFYWANPAAAYFIPAILIGGWRWITKRRPADGIFAAVSATAFWMTDSRGGVLVLALVLVAAVVASRTVRQAWKRLLVFGLITLALGFGLSAIKSHFNHTSIELGSRYSEAAQGESTSVSDRLSYLQSAAQIWWDHPLLGTGAGTFATVHPQYQHRVTDASSDVHNVYVQTLAEQGIVGAMLLAWVILAALLGMWNGVRKHPERAPIALGTVALLLHAGLDIDARYPALLVLTAVLIGCVYQPWVRRTPKGTRQLVLPGLLVLTLVLSISYYQSDSSRNRGQIYDSNHDLNAAAASYQKAHTGLVYDPDNWSSEGIDYFSLATLTNGSSSLLEKSRDRAQQAVKRDPYDSQQYLLLARTEYQANNLGAALVAYRQALSYDHYNHAEYYQDLVSLQLKMGDTVGAQRTVDQALGMYTDAVIANRSADPLMRLAVAQLLAYHAADQLGGGDQAGAKASLDRAAKLNPLNGDVNQLQQQLTTTSAL